jgi:DNA polymerase-3 subunit delta'
MNPVSLGLFLAITSKLPQSLLLTGAKGVGLSTIAKYIASLSNLNPIIVLPMKDEKIDIEKGVIGVDIMRRLYDETRTKTVERRIIIIDYAQRMTIQSQNAFLKLLEEPGENVYFILVSHSTTKLLPTILSRVAMLGIKPITYDQTSQLLDSLGVTDDKKRSQLLFMALGLPAELTNLVNDNDYFEKRRLMVQDARELLRANLYDKLLIAQRYKDNRESVLLLLLDVANILQKSIIDKPRADTINHINKLLKTYQLIEANGNIRICLAQMIF